MRNNSPTPIEKYFYWEAFLQKQFLIVPILYLSQATEYTSMNRVLQHKLQWAQMWKTTSHNRGNGMISKEFQLPRISHKYLSQLQFRNVAKYLLSGMQRKTQASSPNSQHSQGSNSNISSDITENAAKLQAMWMLFDQYLA